MWVLSGYRKNKYTPVSTKVFTMVFNKLPTETDLIDRVFPELKDRNSPLFLLQHHKFAKKLLKKKKADINPDYYVVLEERKPVYGG